MAGYVLASVALEGLPTGDSTTAAIIDVDSKHSLSAKEGQVFVFKRLPRILAFLSRESSTQGPQA